MKEVCIAQYYNSTDTASAAGRAYPEKIPPQYSPTMID